MDELCKNLEQNGIKCWIAPRDVDRGAVFAEEITEAVRACRVVLLLLTVNSNASQHVFSEVTLASDEHKPVLPFRIGDFKLSDALAFYLSKIQRIEAGDDWVSAIPELVKSCQSELKLTPANYIDLSPGKEKFNLFLTKNLIESILEEGTGYRKFSDWMKITPNWETYPKAIMTAKEIIITSFVGVIGKEIEKLMAIGEEEFSGAKLKKYINTCQLVCRRSMDLVIFTLLSKLWEIRKDKSVTITDKESAIIATKFDSPVELTLVEQVNILLTLTNIYLNPANQCDLPFSELSSLAEDEDSRRSLIALTDEMQKLVKEVIVTDDCFRAEQILTGFLKNFSFLAKYQMATVKLIGYRKIRFDEPRYIHRLVALKAKVETERVDYATTPTNSDSVILFKGEAYRENINLFPFVIDYHALIFEHGSKICFFQGTTVVDDRLEFVFAEDNNSVFLEKKGILDRGDPNEIFLKDENIKDYNIDCVVHCFNEARRVILGEPDF